MYSRGVHRGGAKGAMASPRADFGGGHGPPQNFQKFDFRGAKVSFLGGKINFEGCNSRKKFRALRKSFLRFVQKIWPPPSQNPVDAPECNK